MIASVCPAAALPTSLGEGVGKNHTTEQFFGTLGFLVMALWCTFFLLSPVYVMPSGLPQVADFLIVILMPALWLLEGLRIPRKGFPIVNAMSLFVVYAATVNLVWSALLSDPDVASHATFFIFNLGVCVVCLTLYRRYGRRSLHWTAAAVCVSILIQVVVSSRVTVAEGVRVTGFFNNPNQLGFYALLYASLFWVWSESVRLPRALAVWVPLVVYGGTVYLVALSLSRAAVGAVALLMILAGVRNKVVLVAGLLVIGVLALSGTEWSRMEGFEARVEKKSRGVYDEAMNRGYDRMLNHPQYLLFGAGEGAQYRINSKRPAEMHSTLGTVLFCYGAVGMALFLYIFYVMARGCGLSSLLYLLPATLHGMTHMGLRQSELWLLPIMVVCLKWPDESAAAEES